MTTDRAKVSHLASKVAGMLVAGVLALFCAYAYMQHQDDADAQKLSQMIAERK